MKKIISVLLLVLTGICANAQAPIVQWQRSLGSSHVDAGMSVERTSDGGYIALCLTDGSNDGDFPVNYGSTDIWVVRFTSWGNIIWKKQLGGSLNDFPSTIRQTTDGGYIIAGQTLSTDGDVTSNHGGGDYWVVKLDDTGHIQWQKTYGGSNWDMMTMIQQTTDGGYIGVGQSKSTDGDVTGNHGGEDIWVIKISATGALEWQKSYGGTAEEDGSAIQQTADGGYIVAGNTASFDGDVTGNHGLDIWILKLSSAGAIVWEQCYGGSGDEENGSHDYPGNIAQTADGGYIFVGETQSVDGDVTGFHGGTFYDYWVVKLSSTGGIVWQKTYGGTSDDDGYDIRELPGGGYIVCGTSNSIDGDRTGALGGFDYWILKLTSGGGIVWEKSYGGTMNEFPFCIRAVSDTDFIVCGYSKSNDVDVSGNHGDYDGWVAKLGNCSLPVTNAISGPSLVCGGSVIYLSDITPGGAWSASNGNATVSAGIVTGINNGSVAIFYTKTNSCGTGGATHIVNVSKPSPVIVATGTTLSTTTTFVKYQWIKNGTPVPGATNATYVATGNGIYSVTVTNTYSCTATSAADTVSGIGVSTISNNSFISVIPNPTNGLIYIKGAASISIRVYNVIGQLIKEANNADNISITEFPPGVYIVRLYDEQGRFIWQEKVMKE